MIQRRNQQVDAFLDALDHPLREEIKLLRNLLLNSGIELDELIKWNAPSYSWKGQDCITMKLFPPKSIQIIFHRGAKVQELPSQKLIDDLSGLLSWKSNDRAVMTFKNAEEICKHRTGIEAIVNKWIKAL